MIICDLSHWNFPANATEADVELALTRAKIAGLGAVLWKCTESTNVIDQTYAWGQVICQKLGILFAGYHFFRHGDPDAQLAWFLQNANNPTRKALDFEDGEIPGAEVFAQRLQKRDNRYPLLYTRQSFIYEKIGRAATLLSNCDLWLASYTNAAVMPSQWLTYALWQYTDAGRLDGFSGDIDLNRFNYALGDIATWWRGNVTMPLKDAKVLDLNEIETHNGPSLSNPVNGVAIIGKTYSINTSNATKDAANDGIIMYELEPEHWINGKYLQFADNTNPQPVPTPPPDPTPAPSQDPVTRWVNTPGTTLRVRLSPSTSANVLQLLPDKTQVQITPPIADASPHYVQLFSVNGKTAAGYVSNDYLTVTAPK